LAELVGLVRYTKRLQNLSGSEGVEFELHRAASMSTEVYDSNVNKIVSLSDAEVEILTHLYDELKSANKTFRAVAEASIGGEEIDINGIEDYAEDILSELPIAIAELKKRLDESDIPDFAKNTNNSDN
ncbi:MAG TPA: hypothetical protein VFJ06_10290, partial [Halococcus sp.]|nr:hypothetical protein [Halococcus sp.]